MCTFYIDHDIKDYIKNIKNNTESLMTEARSEQNALA